MSHAKMTFPTIWDQADARRPVVMPLLRGVWRGMMKLAEAQCRAQSRRGFLPYV
ncbi:hypothetical protein HOP52_15595 [Halomonas campisalis]|uniref:Uncharacterized protein n=1 Tax=Billgrantia campisalis TaxID=74661 RepID=A0ABS9PD53_9GAMM|nr:hypothetical protein [Halomonas campisalis]MCG6659182.1 hypothetical protein [Halomonas campisalis]MDR5864982.1 hypothetical protein [Halomonas campisalis]